MMEERQQKLKNSLTQEQLSSELYLIRKEDRIINEIMNASIQEFKEYMYSDSVNIKDIPPSSREAICLKMEAIVTAMTLKIMQIPI